MRKRVVLSEVLPGGRRLARLSLLSFLLLPRLGPILLTLLPVRSRQAFDTPGVMP